MKMNGQAALPEQEIRAETLFTRLRVTKKEVPVFARKVGKKGGVIIFALEKIRFHNESSLTKDENPHS